MFRRILGLIIMIVAILLMLVSIAGAAVINDVIDGVGVAVDNLLGVTGETLAATSATLEQTKATIAEANATMTTVEQTAVNLSRTVSDTQPLLESTTTVVTEQVPENIEALQQALPVVAEVAGVVDNTLQTLSNLGISQEIPIPFSDPLTLEFDLGIDYEPGEPFDQALLDVGDSLEGLPDELRSLQSDLETTTENLATVSEDIMAISDDLAAANEQIALFIPILDDYLGILDQIDASLVQVQAQLDTQLELLGWGAIALFVLLALTQLAPLYIGWELVSGARRPAEGDTVPQAPTVIVEGDATVLDDATVVEEHAPAAEEATAPTVETPEVPVLSQEEEQRAS